MLSGNKIIAELKRFAENQDEELKRYVEVVCGHYEAYINRDVESLDIEDIRAVPMNELNSSQVKVIIEFCREFYPSLLDQIVLPFAHLSSLDSHIRVYNSKKHQFPQK